MFNKISLYFYTIISLKPSQVYFRILKKLGIRIPLGVSVSSDFSNVQTIQTPVELDFDQVFVERFPVAELIEDTITILHSSKNMDWNSTWEFADKSALWNFNLHYFEYLFPLVKAWKDTGEKQYLNKTIEMIEGWIDVNPKGSNPAWASYTTALRIVTWISWYGYVGDGLDGDFRQKFLSSLHDQFSYLSTHLEKDILGNHYFEDLKSLVLAAIFFNDNAVLETALRAFKTECKEEILSDGMHFELSPMYHKIILEGMLRIAVALRGAGRKDQEIEAYLQPMLDVAYSFEDGLERVPLFNDGGNNVTKSLDALIKTAETLGYEPKFKGKLKESGFYIFPQYMGVHSWKLIVDAGQPGPKYIPGHAHCDAMSFELFCDGKPVVVNCGTYAYQCKERSFFRSTAAHNTVMVDGTEQSQCWRAFRLAKRSKVRIVDVNDHYICMEMTDQNGEITTRQITFSDSLIIADKTDGKKIDAYLHFLEEPEGVNGVFISDGLKIYCDGMETVGVKKQPYAVDYGEMKDCYAIQLSGESTVSVQIGMEG